MNVQQVFPLFPLKSFANTNGIQMDKHTHAHYTSPITRLIFWNLFWNHLDGRGKNMCQSVSKNILLIIIKYIRIFFKVNLLLGK